MSTLYEDAKKLVDKMTIEEVASQLKYDAEEVKRLGIPSYNWWNEALHGVARAGVATVFPQAIGLAAMFDEEELFNIAEVISTEARAKYNTQFKFGDTDIYKGLTMWSPNINIFRDPRWGRGHETYGEDPYLTSRLGVSFIKGLQGIENYPECDTLKVAACAKHYAVHSGPEGERHHFNAIANKKDMEETYLPAFEAAVKEGKVESVMGAYNRTNDEPCCGSETLIKKNLREKWGFEGHFVSDCWAVRDFHENHKITNKPSESAAMALNAGCDLNCGNTYLCILAALKEGLVKEEDLRKACIRLMKTRMKLGILPRSDADAVAKTDKYDTISYLENDTDESRALALKAAQKSLVMLENNGVLPLREGEYETIGIIGPTADLRTVLEGNYNGTASLYVTNLNGIRQSTKSRILYSQGCHLYMDRTSNLAKESDRISEALSVTANSDIVILCLGLDATIEGEEGDTGNMFASGDKNSLRLPDTQINLYEKVIGYAKENNKKVIAVINAGSAIDVSYLKENADALLFAWYSGEQGGQALSDVIFGKVSPSGKLPVTFYKDGCYPEFTDYSMKGRTYRYCKDNIIYPFGYGLSYSDFETECSLIKTAELPEKADYINDQYDVVNIKVKVKNNGIYDADHVILAYVDKKPSEKKENGLNNSLVKELDPDNQPIKSLCAFKRVSVGAAKEVSVSIPIKAFSFSTVLEDGSRVYLKGKYDIIIDDRKFEIEF